MYRQEGLNLRNKGKHKRISAPGVMKKNELSSINECWSMDFVSDQLYNCKRFRTLTILNLYTRECIEIYADKAIKGETVTEVLDRLKNSRGLPQRI